LSFLGLNIAIGALRAQQYGMNTTAHNIANAGTKGYHRQEAVFLSGAGLTGWAGTTGIGVPQIGSGVSVQTIRRMQSDYIDGQVRLGSQWIGTCSERNEALKQIESVLSEPGELGLASAMDRFWNSWEELSASPGSLPARISVVESGVALAQRIRTLYQDIRELQVRTDSEIGDTTVQINRLAHEIGELNKQIGLASADDSQPNDLLDRRDVLLNELSSLVRIDAYGGNNSELIVSVGGRALVQGSYVSELKTERGGDGMLKVLWAEDDAPAQILGGKLLGQLQVRDELTAGYIQSLNEIAEALVTRVNGLHSTGILTSGAPAGDFFVAGSDASSIAVEPGLVANAAGVATSTTGNPGDNSLALAISAIRNEILPNGQTIGGTYSALVARIGADSREAGSQTEAHTLALQQLESQRESISGVSIDEEMVNMVRFQQAFNAAARIVTVIDEMLDTVISRMGVGGR